MNNTIAILALRAVNGIGSVAIKRLWQQGIFSGDNYYNQVERALILLKKQISDNEIESLVSQSKNQLDEIFQYDISVVDLGSLLYPKQLRELNKPPSVLFYKGNIEMASKTIGIVGTREPNAIGLEIAKRVGQYFSERGFSICNGLAMGIDEASIRTDIGIRTNVVGVVAGGLNYNSSKTLSKSTSMLVEQVLESGGLIVSEYTVNIKEDTFKIVDSCAIQAGLSNGLILVQSKNNGGSRYTIGAFAELNRPLGVVSLNDMEKELLFEANTSILGNPIEGISSISGIKAEKIKLAKCLAITQKSDYAEFEKLLNNNSIKGHDNPSLF